jgi:hypothetical protein
MSFPTFSFPTHLVTDDFPKNSSVTAFGNGYTFASAPVGPPQITFHLEFKTMCWFTTGTPNGAFDRTYSPAVMPGMNLAALIDFYAAQQLYNPFWYPHQVRGSVLVRFGKPFTTPKSVTGSLIYVAADSRWAHFTEGFNIDLVMQPT